MNSSGDDFLPDKKLSCKEPLTVGLLNSLQRVEYSIINCCCIIEQNSNCSVFALHYGQEKCNCKTDLSKDLRLT